MGRPVGYGTGRALLDGVLPIGEGTLRYGTGRHLLGKGGAHDGVFYAVAEDFFISHYSFSTH